MFLKFAPPQIPVVKRLFFSLGAPVYGTGLVVVVDIHGAGSLIPISVLGFSVGIQNTRREFGEILGAGAVGTVK